MGLKLANDLTITSKHFPNSVSNNLRRTKGKFLVSLDFLVVLTSVSFIRLFSSFVTLLLSQIDFLLLFDVHTG